VLRGHSLDNVESHFMNALVVEALKRDYTAL
jgi:hypothetical protein